MFKILMTAILYDNYLCLPYSFSRMNKVYIPENKLTLLNGNEIVVFMLSHHYLSSNTVSIDEQMI